MSENESNCCGVAAVPEIRLPDQYNNWFDNASAIVVNGTRFVRADAKPPEPPPKRKTRGEVVAEGFIREFNESSPYTDFYFGHGGWGARLHDSDDKEAIIRRARLRAHIAQLLDAETERCAKIVETLYVRPPREITQAIRDPEAR